MAAGPRKSRSRQNVLILLKYDKIITKHFTDSWDPCNVPGKMLYQPVKRFNQPRRELRGAGTKHQQGVRRQRRRRERTSRKEQGPNNSDQQALRFLRGGRQPI